MEFQKAKRQHKAESLIYRYDKYEKDTHTFSKVRKVKQACEKIRGESAASRR